MSRRRRRGGTRPWSSAGSEAGQKRPCPQRAILPWRADLTALANYGYSPDEIAAAEDRMDKLAAERIAEILILGQLTG